MLKDTPKISVIIPCFLQMECSSTNRFPYFEYFEPTKECKASVISQEYKNIEVILADYKSELGQNDIRNNAINKSTGEIIFFLCPEATLIDNKQLNNLISVFKTTSADVIVGSSIANRHNCPLFIYLLNLEYEHREEKMGERLVSAGATSYFAIKKSVLNSVGGFPVSSICIKTNNAYFDSAFPDWDFCALLKEKGYKIWHTHKLKVYHIYQTKIISYFKKQFIHAWYRIAYLHRFHRIKEGYTNNYILIQFTLFILLFSMGIATIVLPKIFFRIFVFNLIIVTLWNLLLILYFFIKTKDIRVFFLLIICFMRGFMWVFGAIKGFIDFYILKRGIP